jgi:hypothetical protein
MTPAEVRAMARCKASLYGEPGGDFSDVLLERCRRVLERTLYVTWCDGDVDIYPRYAEGREAVFGSDFKYEIFGVLGEYL